VRSDVLRIAVSLVFILGGAVGMAATIIPEIDSGPLNTTYFIEGQPILLKHGKQERPAAPGSATGARSAVSGEPVYGKLDTDCDAALFLAINWNHQSAGNNRW